MRSAYRGITICMNSDACWIRHRLVDVNLVDIGFEVVADRPRDDVRFAVNLDRRRHLLDPLDDDLPESEQINQVALQFFRVLFDGRRADDEADALRRFEFVHDLAEPAAGRHVFDLPRDADPRTAASARDTGRRC